MKGSPLTTKKAMLSIMGTAQAKGIWGEGCNKKGKLRRVKSLASIPVLQFAAGRAANLQSGPGVLLEL